MATLAPYVVRPKAHEVMFRERQVGDGYSPAAVHTTSAPLNWQWNQQGMVNARLDDCALAVQGAFIRKKAASMTYNPASNFTMTSESKSANYSPIEFVGRKRK